MKTMGIIRRIDDLGRVVIPKEIRQVATIKEGDPLDINMVQVEGKWCVLLSQYNADDPGTDLGKMGGEKSKGTPYKTLTLSTPYDGTVAIYNLDKNCYDLFLDLYNNGFLNGDLDWEEGNSIEEKDFF